MLSIMLSTQKEKTAWIMMGALEIMGRTVLAIPEVAPPGMLLVGRMWKSPEGTAALKAVLMAAAVQSVDVSPMARPTLQSVSSTRRPRTKPLSVRVRCSSSHDKHATVRAVS